MSLQKLEFSIIYSIKMKPTKLSPITLSRPHQTHPSTDPSIRENDISI